MTGRVLVLGGYGTFGRLICRQLVARAIPICIAGRSRTKAEALATELGPGDITVQNLDIQDDLMRRLQANPPSVLIHAAGPFQGQDYTVAHACIGLGIHYVDLADGRAFVGSISSLGPAACDAGVAVISGASTVPALSSAVLQSLAPDFVRMDRLCCGITPGQRTPRGRAAAQAVLGYAGRMIPPSGLGTPVRYGWGGLYRVPFPTLGKRWMSSCDAPDLDLFPTCFGVRDVHFCAGMEMAPVHLGLWALAALVRRGMPLNLPHLTPVLLWLASLFHVFGSADGGLFLEVRGVGKGGTPLVRRWVLEVFDGYGPYVPTVPAVLLAARLVHTGGEPGARPCVGLISLGDYLAALPQDLIRVSIT